jgi:hypothetical protein
MTDWLLNIDKGPSITLVEQYWRPRQQDDC